MSEDERKMFREAEWAFWYWLDRYGDYPFYGEEDKVWHAACWALRGAWQRMIGEPPSERILWNLLAKFQTIVGETA